MKKLTTLSLSILAVILIAAPAMAVSYPLFVNGRLLGNAVVVEGGIIAIQLEDFAKASGAPMTLEPLFEVQGNRLLSKMSTAVYEKHPGSPASVKIREAAVDPQVKYEAISKGKQTAPLLLVQRPGLITSHLIMVNGRMFIPLTDFIRAMGDGSTHNFGNLKPGEAIRLNFTKNQNSIIAILIGL